jgi:hypothetical protein
MRRLLMVAQLWMSVLCGYLDLGKDFGVENVVS